MIEDEPSYDISVLSETTDAAGIEAFLTGAVEAALTRHRVRNARVSVAVVDDIEIARLNEHHLKRNEPTDVLAFDLSGEDSSSPVCGPERPVDGDIVVSIETARREAHGRGHGVDAELSLYAIHGTLHLLGYDDRESDDAAKMHEVEDDILTTLGFGPVFEAPPP